MKRGNLIYLAAIPFGYLLLRGSGRVKGPSAEEEREWPEEARFLDQRLFNPPVMPNEEDRFFSAWIGDSRSGSQLSSVDVSPRAGKRHLTAYEKWALRPYFPYAPDLDEPVINDGIKPPGWEYEQDPEGIRAATSPLTKEIYFPHGPTKFTDRWWLAALAHELWHLAQIRIGLTPEQAAGALMKWGYESSPIEVQARYQQARVYDGLAKSARTFYGAA